MTELMWSYLSYLLQESGSILQTHESHHYQYQEYLLTDTSAIDTSAIDTSALDLQSDDAKYLDGLCLKLLKS